MIKDDAPAFERLMNELAECFDKRHPAEGAMKHWFRSLERFSLPVVQKAVNAWIDSKTKFPAIAEISGHCHAQITIEIEQRKQQNNSAYGTWLRNGPTNIKTPAGLLAVSALKQFLVDAPRRLPSKQWAFDILAAHAAGRGLRYFSKLDGEQDVGPQPVSAVQIEYARAALGGRMPQQEPVRERQPGEDDE